MGKNTTIKKSESSDDFDFTSEFDIPYPEVAINGAMGNAVEILHLQMRATFDFSLIQAMLLLQLTNAIKKSMRNHAWSNEES